MADYIIRFMPEYGGTCLWPKSESAYEQFGNPIQYTAIGLPDMLIRKLESFDEKVMGIIDWNDPLGESPMTVEERDTLYQEGRLLMEETI